MSFLFRLFFLLTLLHHASLAYTSYRSRSQQCYNITSATMPMCANLNPGYDRIMLPNDLAHTTVKEVRAELAQWTRLVDSGCSPHLKILLCSVFAPVCLMQGPMQAHFTSPVPPCQSLCVTVRDSCEPLMRTHNYTWPHTMMNCSTYPKEDLMCVRAPEPTKLPGPCPDDGNRINQNEAQEKYCQGNFAIKARIQETPKRSSKDNNVIILKVKVQKVLRGFIIRSRKPATRLRLPITSDTDCQSIVSMVKGKSTKKSLLIIGNKKGKRITVTYMARWPKKKKAIKKLKTARNCSKY